jgi:GNAT superfamily N-acetyltransferase
MPMSYREATAADCPMLAELNHQLIRDEGHRNPMNPAQLEVRMRRWLASGEYRAILFEEDGEVVAYALFREAEAEVHLRQFFVVRHRRRAGVGRRAMALLRSQIWPQHKRLTVSVLVKNTAGLAFWRAMGYADYDLTLEIMPRT